MYYFTFLVILAFWLFKNIWPARLFLSCSPSLCMVLRTLLNCQPELLIILSFSHSLQTLPFAWALMGRKSQSAYDSVLTHLRTVLAPDLAPTSFMTDFERALQASLNGVYAGACTIVRFEDFFWIITSCIHLALFSALPLSRILYADESWKL